MPPVKSKAPVSSKGPGANPKSPLGEVNEDKDIFSDDEVMEGIKTSTPPPTKKGPKKVTPPPAPEVSEDDDLELEEESDDLDLAEEAPAKTEKPSKSAPIKSTKAPSAKSTDPAEEAVNLILGLDSAIKQQGNTLAGFLKPINETLNDTRNDSANLQAEVKNLQLSVKELMILLTKVVGKLDESHAQLLIEVQHLKQTRKSAVKEETSIPPVSEAEAEEDEEEEEEEEVAELTEKDKESLRRHAKNYSGKYTAQRLADSYVKGKDLHADTVLEFLTEEGLVGKNGMLV